MGYLLEYVIRTVMKPVFEASNFLRLHTILIYDLNENLNVV